MANSTSPDSPKKQRDKRSRAPTGPTEAAGEFVGSGSAAVDEDALVASFSAVKLGTPF